MDFKDKHWHLTDPTSRQRGRPNKRQIRNLQKKKKKKKIYGQMSLIWARHQDILTDWPSVAMWLWLWLWLWLWESVYKISRSWVDVLISLCPFIYSRVSGLMGFGDGSDKGTSSNYMKISEKCDEDPGNDYTSTSCGGGLEYLHRSPCES
jgi:hypothetical protein